MQSAGGQSTVSLSDVEIDSEFEAGQLGIIPGAYLRLEISDHHTSWGYEDGPWKVPRPPLLVAADF